MRYCATCGAPIADHPRRPIDAITAMEIMSAAPNRAAGKARVRHAMRVCPIVEVRPGVFRVDAEKRAAQLEEAA